MGLLDGILHVVPGARVGHIGLYRDPKTLVAVEYYFKMPSGMAERDAIVLDPMLATGNSAVAAVDAAEGSAAALDPVRLPASRAPRASARSRTRIPTCRSTPAAIDSQLNDHGYILPGLGDAGDRIFGTK